MAPAIRQLLGVDGIRCSCLACASRARACLVALVRAPDARPWPLLGAHLRRIRARRTLDSPQLSQGSWNPRRMPHDELVQREPGTSEVVVSWKSNRRQPRVSVVEDREFHLVVNFHNMSSENPAQFSSRLLLGDVCKFRRDFGRRACSYLSPSTFVFLGPGSKSPRHFELAASRGRRVQIRLRGEPSKRLSSRLVLPD